LRIRQGGHVGNSTAAKIQARGTLIVGLGEDLTYAASGALEPRRPSAHQCRRVTLIVGRTPAGFNGAGVIGPDAEARATDRRHPRAGSRKVRGDVSDRL